MMVWKMVFLFQGGILRFHVNLLGCNQNQKPRHTLQRRQLGHLQNTKGLFPTTTFSTGLGRGSDGDCWWLKSGKLTSWYSKYPIIYRVLAPSKRWLVGDGISAINSTTWSSEDASCPLTLELPPPPSNSHHQDYYISKEAQSEPLTLPSWVGGRPACIVRITEVHKKMSQWF